MSFGTSETIGPARALQPGGTPNKMVGVGATAKVALTFFLCMFTWFISIGQVEIVEYQLAGTDPLRSCRCGWPRLLAIERAIGEESRL